MKQQILGCCLVAALCMCLLMPVLGEETDFLENATLVTPLPTDTQEDDIISATKELVKDHKLYSTHQAATLEYQAFFLYHENFNQGFIPVWIVYIKNEGTVEWKAAYGYNGCLMSMVPYQEDFTCYQLPNENFWYNSYSGWDSSAELQAFADLFDGVLSFEQRVQTAERWKPYVAQWIVEHPYYLNDPGFEYTITMEETYGIPDENALSEQEAIKLAQAEMVRMGADESTIETRIVKTDYYVTDPQNPVWNLNFSSIRVKGMSVEEKRSDITNTSTFQVKIHAYSGDVVFAHMEGSRRFDFAGDCD